MQPYDDVGKKANLFEYDSGKTKPPVRESGKRN